MLPCLALPCLSRLRSLVLSLPLPLPLCQLCTHRDEGLHRERGGGGETEAERALLGLVRLTHLTPHHTSPLPLTTLNLSVAGAVIVAVVGVDVGVIPPGPHPLRRPLKR